MSRGAGEPPKWRSVRLLPLTRTFLQIRYDSLNSILSRTAPRQPRAILLRRDPDRIAVKSIRAHTGRKSWIARARKRPIRTASRRRKGSRAGPKAGWECLGRLARCERLVEV